MYDVYIEDAYHLAVVGTQEAEEKSRKRYYRAAIFYSVSAVEAFVNYVGETLSQGGKFPPYEIAFLIDKRFDIVEGTFYIVDTPKYNRLEDKLRFLLNKFVGGYDFSNKGWADFMEFKRFRDTLVHPHDSADSYTAEEYESKLQRGINASLDLINLLCKGIFGKNLRKGLLELRL